MPILRMQADERTVAYEEQLAHQALHDPPTGLANRALLSDRLTPSSKPPPRCHQSVVHEDVVDLLALVLSWRSKGAKPRVEGGVGIGTFGPTEGEPVGR